MPCSLASTRAISIRVTTAEGAGLRLWKSVAMSAVVVGVGVTKRFGATSVLSNATFEVSPGVTGLLGPNGAGKTTLLSLLLGLHRPDAGRIEVLGLDPLHFGPEIRARIGYAPEHHLLPPDLPAIDYVCHLAEIHGLPRSEAATRASDALWWVALGEERFRALGTLSTGQRQRVKLAAAIAPDPALIVLDEPTDGLDPTQRDAMLDLIRRIGTDVGIDVIMSSHLLDEVERTCDQVIVLDDGHVAAAGSLDQLRGAERGIRLVVDGDPTELVASLRSRGVDVVVDRSRIDVQCASYDQATLQHLVRDELARSGVGLRELRPRIRSLSDVILGVAP